MKLFNKTPNVNKLKEEFLDDFIKNLKDNHIIYCDLTDRFNPKYLIDLDELKKQCFGEYIFFSKQDLINSNKDYIEYITNAKLKINK